MKYTVHELKDTKELKAFADFPNKLYKDNPYYIPGLMSDDINTFNWEKNPSFEYCEAKYWFAMDGNKIVGRVCGIINYKYIEIWKNKYGRFGFIDFIEDYDVAKLLLDTVIAWVKEKGMDGIIGPLGFCDMDPEGMLVKGFDEVSTLTTIYNYSYYPEYLERYGFEKDVDWFEYKMQVVTIPDQMREIAKRVEEKYELRVYHPTSMKKLVKKYGHAVFELLNDTYGHLYSVVPLTERQIQAFIKQYMGLLTQDYVRLIVDKDDNLISFGIGMPNMNDILKKHNGRLNPISAIKMLMAMKSKHPKVIDLLLIATRDDYQKKGVNAMLLCEVYGFAKERGVEYFNLNPQLESNIKVRHSFKHFDVENNKVRRSYILHFNKTESV